MTSKKIVKATRVFPSSFYSPRTIWKYIIDYLDCFGQVSDNTHIETDTSSNFNKSSYDTQIDFHQTICSYSSETKI